MSRELAGNIEALELGLHAHTDYTMALAGSEATGWIASGPTSPYLASIIYWTTYGNILARTLQLESQQRGYSYGLKVVDSDELEHGATSWLYVTNVDPMYSQFTNLDVVARTFYLTFWSINIVSLQDLDIIKVVLWEHFSPGMLSILRKSNRGPKLPNLPTRILDDLISRDLAVEELVKELKGVTG